MAGIAGVGVLVWFLLRQRTLEYPLVDVRLFRGKAFAVAIATGLLSSVAWSAAAYLTGVYLQSVLGLSVFEAALLALPGAVVLMLACVFTPAAVERIGERYALVSCHFFMAVGLILLLATTATRGILWYAVSTVVSGVGYGISFSLVADTAVGAVPANRGGSAGAIAETSNEVGNALGIALLGSAATLVFRLCGPGIAPTLGETLAAELSDAVRDQAKEAFVCGLHTAAGIAALLCAGLGVLALRWIPRKPLWNKYSK